MQNPNKPGQWGFVWHSYIDNADAAVGGHAELRDDLLGGGDGFDIHKHLPLSFVAVNRRMPSISQTAVRIQPKTRSYNHNTEHSVG
jgi:hypothetical protein